MACLCGKTLVVRRSTGSARGSAQRLLARGQLHSVSRGRSRHDGRDARPGRGVRRRGAGAVLRRRPRHRPGELPPAARDPRPSSLGRRRSRGGGVVLPQARAARSARFQGAHPAGGVPPQVRAARRGPRPVPRRRESRCALHVLRACAGARVRRNGVPLTTSADVERPFRFGVRFGVRLSGRSPLAWLRDRARQAEQLGYDVLMLPDHLDTVSAFPALAALAGVTTRPRLGTFVLNTAFYNPALLARDAATLDMVTDGRFDLGLGAGWAEHEFDEAGLPFPAAGARVAHLEHTLAVLRQRFGAAPRPRILVAGSGKRLLAAAAREADTLSLASVPVHTRPVTDAVVEQALAARIAHIRSAACRPVQDLELGLTLGSVTLAGHGAPDLSMLRNSAPGLSDDELPALPGVLHGAPAEIAETLVRYRERHHLTHFVAPAADMVAFAQVIDRIRGHRCPA
ncbi:MAG: TIGR03621 family F420-dependent LLM class oxidoreductase [Mycobacteriaceae bacterium]|nr:TIGR03621 family F420-dependent LLM class oxidoreductase [Mycobacteriaceae bacterium]